MQSNQFDLRERCDCSGGLMRRRRFMLGSQVCAVLGYAATVLAQGTDSCTNPTQITGFGPHNFNTTSATSSFTAGFACNFGAVPGIPAQMDNDLWFCWINNECLGPSAQISTCRATTTGDTMIAVYPGGCSCPTSSPSSCNDDDLSCVFSGFLSFVAPCTHCCDAMLIQIGNYPGTTGAQGEFTINCDSGPVSCDPGPEACCFPDHTCQDIPPECCVELGGKSPGGGYLCQGDLNSNGIDDACEDCDLDGIPDMDETGPTVCLGAIPIPDPNCGVAIPFTPNFNVVEKWHWPYTEDPVSGIPAAFPNHTQVMMTPVVADLNRDGRTEIIFSSFEGAGYSCDGVLRVIDGNTGLPVSWFTFPASTPNLVYPAGAIAVGDIAGDGKLEICANPASPTTTNCGPSNNPSEPGLICFNYNGTILSPFPVQDPTSPMSWGGVSIAELHLSSQGPEIIAGNTVLRSTGALLWSGPPASGGPFGPISFAADMNDDGTEEVVIGGSIYTTPGLVPVANWPHRSGLSAVGDFDGDREGELVVVNSGTITVFDDNGSPLAPWPAAGIPIPGGGAGGAPTVGNFDCSDLEPEIGVVGASRYTVFNHDRTILWQAVIDDATSNCTGSSVFDFEGDGQAEVVYNDQQTLWIFNGATGAVRFSIPNCSCTTYENPVIADVDGDCDADIVVTANEVPGCPLCQNPSLRGPGVRVFSDANDGWVNTRAIWNQHAYSITNVNDNGSIPDYIEPNWLPPTNPPADPPNTFRANSQGSTVCPVLAAPDLTVVEVNCSGCQNSIQATVANIGAVTAPPTTVTFYATTNAICCPAIPPLGTEMTPPLAPGAIAVVKLSVPGFASSAVLHAWMTIIQSWNATRPTTAAAKNVRNGA